MMFGGVPIRVIRPPRIEPNDSGINSAAGLPPRRSASGISRGQRADIIHERR